MTEAAASIYNIIPTDTGKGKIFYAFIKLLENTPYKKIKISELIEKAGVNRSTFYRYYTDINDYYDKTCEVGIAYLLSDLETCFADITDLELCFSKVADSVEKNVLYALDVIRLLTGKNGSSGFFNDFRYCFTDRIEKICRSKGINNIETTTVFRDYGNLVCMSQLKFVLGETQFEDFETSGFRYDPQRNILDNITILATGKDDFRSAGIVYTLGELMLTKGKKYCTVNNIMKFAGLSRTEFYSYFRNTDSAVIKSVLSAAYVMSQILTDMATCPLEAIGDYIPPERYEFGKIKEVDLIEAAKACDQFYFFVAWCYGYTTEKLMRIFFDNPGNASPEQKKAVDIFTGAVFSQLLYYAEEPNREAFISGVLIRRKRLTDNGIG